MCAKESVPVNNTWRLAADGNSRSTASVLGITRNTRATLGFGRTSDSSVALFALFTTLV
jgi:hypothetical protein